MRRFLDLAHRHGITVWWLLPPVRPGHLSVSESTGDEARYVESIRREQARWPHVVVIDGRYANVRAGVFVDRVHINRDGAVALSIAPGKALKDGRTGVADDQRWVQLPGFTEPPTQLALEDVARSVRVIKDGLARRQR